MKFLPTFISFVMVVLAGSVIYAKDSSPAGPATVVAIIFLLGFGIALLYHIWKLSELSKKQQ